MKKTRRRSNLGASPRIEIRGFAPARPWWGRDFGPGIILLVSDDASSERAPVSAAEVSSRDQQTGDTAACRSCRKTLNSAIERIVR